MNTSSNNTEKFLFEFFLGFLGQIKIYHWSTMSYATHKALDELHSSLSDNIDEFMEVYIGKYNKQPIDVFNINIKGNSDTTNIIQYLQTQRDHIRTIRNKQFKSCSEIQNILDTMMGEINKTIYLCNLK
jgi:DNA-binding ferritin-like protein